MGREGSILSVLLLCTITWPKQFRGEMVYLGTGFRGISGSRGGEVKEAGPAALLSPEPKASHRWRPGAELAGRNLGTFEACL